MACCERDDHGEENGDIRRSSRGTEDLAKGLHDAFTLEPSAIQSAPLLHEPPMSNDRYTATVWSVPAKHTGRFVGLEPTQREIVIHGVTIVQLPRAKISRCSSA